MIGVCVYIISQNKYLRFRKKRKKNEKKRGQSKRHLGH